MSGWWFIDIYSCIVRQLLQYLKPVLIIGKDYFPGSKFELKKEYAF